MVGKVKRARDRIVSLKTKWRHTLDTEGGKVFWIAGFSGDSNDSIPSLQSQRLVANYDIFDLLDLGQRNMNVERQMDQNWRTLVNFFTFKHAQNKLIFRQITEIHRKIVLLFSEQICVISKGLFCVLTAMYVCMLVSVPIDRHCIKYKLKSGGWL